MRKQPQGAPKEKSDSKKGKRADKNSRPIFAAKEKLKSPEKAEQGRPSQNSNRKKIVSVALETMPIPVNKFDSKVDINERFKMS